MKKINKLEKVGIAVGIFALVEFAYAGISWLRDPVPEPQTQMVMHEDEFVDANHRNHFIKYNAYVPIVIDTDVTDLEYRISDNILRLDLNLGDTINAKSGDISGNFRDCRGGISVDRDKVFHAYEALRENTREEKRVRVYGVFEKDHEFRFYRVEIPHADLNLNLLVD